MAEKKRWKLKFNLFDGIVILLALAIAVGAVTYVRRRSAASAPEGTQTSGAVQVTVRYTLEIEQAYDAAAALAREGDELYERTKKQYLGKVESLEILPATVLAKDTVNGRFLFTEVPGRSNIKMQVTTQGIRTEEGTTLDSGLEIRVGDSFRVCGPGYYGTGYVTHMERS